MLQLDLSVVDTHETRQNTPLRSVCLTEVKIMFICGRNRAGQRFLECLVSAPECLPMEVSVSEGSILLQSIIFVR